MFFSTQEGDLIVGEVHEIYKDGSLQLHMPGQRSGRLGGGCLLKLPPNCIKRQKLHRHRLLVPRASALLRESFPASSLSSGGLDLVSATRVGLILGCNGLVWVGLASGADWSGDAPHQTDSNSQPEIETDSLDPMERRRLAVDERLAVARVRNCILALARHRVPIWEMSVLAAFEASWLEDRHQIISGPEAIATDTEAATIDLFAGIAGLLQADASRRLAALVAAKIEASF
ncbi:unnamed protein product [Protopolystoma xenopodis]|uniref:K Homology domain-containing protein n=1 Tax=Protopolystoma xenopodis TaxID=117903 RepID=A0A448X5F3_9PLAT|nr:unnamed protein product [Protopolystoma xenopodis]